MKHIIRTVIASVLSCLMACGQTTSQYHPVVIGSASFATSAHQRPHNAMTNLMPLVDGAVWTLQNPSTGDITTITWSKYNGQFGCEGKNLFLSVWTKSNPRAYFWTGKDVVLDEFFYDDNGMVRSPGVFYQINGEPWTTVDYGQVGPDNNYPMIMDTFQSPTSEDVPYEVKFQYGIPNTNCLGDQYNLEPAGWNVSWSAGSVDTPYYKGPVVNADLIETPNGQHCPMCNHELWSYAPNIGIVQIQRISPGNFVEIQRIKTTE